MPAIATNNAKSTVATALSSSALVVALNDGSSFPSPGTGEYFYLTLIHTDGTTEIVKCTSRSGNNLSIVRAQDGTSAATFPVGSRAELRVTAAYINEAGLAVSKALAVAMVFYG